MLQTNRGVLVATMLKYNRGVYAALIVWLATVLSGCSQPMVNMEASIVDREQEARGGPSQNRMEPDIGTPNNSGVGAIHHVAAQSGQDASVGDQGSGVAGGRATMVSQQQSPPYPTVYGGYRAFGAQAWQAYFGVDV
ncbi:MAG: hypothetical protein ACX93T_04430, partial [Bacteroidota bacterium]